MQPVQIVWVATVVAVMMFCPACGKSKRKRQYDVVYVKEDDPKMNKAIHTARKSVGEFTAALNKPGRGQMAFAIKVPVKDTNGIEHFWAKDVTFVDKKFSATLDNDPEIVKNVKVGDPITCDPDKISDWMYINNGVLAGGYTIRVMREKLTEQERNEMDRTLPFKIR